MLNSILWWTVALSILALLWRHNGHGSVSNHQPHDCLLNRLFRRRSKKTSKLSVTALYVWNSSRTGKFPAQMSSNAESFSFDDVIMDTGKITLITFWSQVTNAALILFREPSVTIIVSDVKYGISTLDSSNILPLILRWFNCLRFETWNFHCQRSIQIVL